MGSPRVRVGWERPLSVDRLVERHAERVLVAPRIDRLAAVLRPGRGAPVAGDHLAREILWAALDCPSYAPELYGKLALLARFSAAIARDVGPEETLVAVGWGEGGEGRKHHTASALLDAPACDCVDISSTTCSNPNS